MSCGCGSGGTYEVTPAGGGAKQTGLTKEQADAIVSAQGGSVRKVS